MAKIVKTTNQETALKIVNNNIRALTEINTMLDIKEESSKIMIATGKEKVFLLLEKSVSDEILKNIQKKLITETKILTRKNAIVLDDRELEILKKYSHKKEIENYIEES